MAAAVAMAEGDRGKERHCDGEGQGGVTHQPREPLP